MIEAAPYHIEVGNPKSLVTQINKYRRAIHTFASKFFNGETSGKVNESLEGLILEKAPTMNAIYRLPYFSTSLCYYSRWGVLQIFSGLSTTSETSYG